MRAYFLALILLMAAGCASDGMHRDWKAEAATLRVSEEEIVAIARSAHERHKLVVIRFDRIEKDAIAVFLADKPNRPHGILVIFRRVDGRWQEDPKSEGPWIV